MNTATANAIIDHLSAFAGSTDFTGGALQGYAAQSAIKTLLANWQAALDDNAECDLAADLAEVVTRLQRFEEEARRALPVQYGGFGGVSMQDWEARLAEQRIYVSPSDSSPGFFGFTGCEADIYPSRGAAVAGAIRTVFG